MTEYSAEAPACLSRFIQYILYTLIILQTTTLSAGYALCQEARLQIITYTDDNSRKLFKFNYMIYCPSF